MTATVLKRKGNSLYVVKPEEDIEVNVKPCFPWSGGKEFLSLRDREQKEILFITSVDDLVESDQSLVREFWRRSQFMIQIIGVNEIREDVELRSFDVQTNIGKRLFQTKLEDWPEIMTDGRILMKDLSGDLFVIDSVSGLDSKSQKILAPYVK